MINLGKRACEFHIDGSWIWRTLQRTQSTNYLFKSDSNNTLSFEIEIELNDHFKTFTIEGPFFIPVKFHP